MSWTIRASEHAEWASFGLDSFDAEIGDYAEYCNQREDYCDSLAGDVYAAPDRTTNGPDGTVYRVLFVSSFSNDHSPWASHYTHAELYTVGNADDEEEYAADLKRYESAPEYLESDDE